MICNRTWCISNFFSISSWKGQKLYWRVRRRNWWYNFYNMLHFWNYRQSKRSYAYSCKLCCQYWGIDILWPWFCFLRKRCAFFCFAVVTCYWKVVLLICDGAPNLIWLCFRWKNTILARYTCPKTYNSKFGAPFGKYNLWGNAICSQNLRRCLQSKGNIGG